MSTALDLVPCAGCGSRSVPDHVYGVRMCCPDCRHSAAEYREAEVAMWREAAKRFADRLEVGEGQVERAEEVARAANRRAIAAEAAGDALAARIGWMALDWEQNAPDQIVGQAVAANLRAILAADEAGDGPR